MKDNEKQSAFFESIKLFLKAVVEILGAFFLFLCRLVALILTKIAELLERKLGNGKNH